MAFSMTNVLNSLVEASTRTPHSVQLSENEDRFVHKPMQRPGMEDMMSQQPVQMKTAPNDGRSSEAIEHDTLARIRDALYRDHQA